ncbi:unnamed protein product [Kuraishia capsulata CBS 1993]|uniref:Uncharacterized protein n=1 Tax=Kuraishia capsulata CBS 1993 TaxID=1382522 RepID=W6MTR6_9ASCO|nr:uncharacterized protein KUCA_T00005867001 [Kuraishia capsulata CBS 1993]CDK29873.1 unnamed protein product [Kuraishia capsulata CBS 1993]
MEAESDKPEFLQTAVTNGEVQVRKSSGKIRVRKGQPEEEFQEQKRQFWKTGPIINEQNWLVTSTSSILAEQQNLDDGADNDFQLGQPETEDQSPLLNMNKIERDRVIHAVERLFYLRKFEECLDLCNVLIGTSVISGREAKAYGKNLESIEDLRAACLRNRAD